MTRMRFLQLLGPWDQGDGHLYVRLAEALRAAIERGDLATGTRLPAQRVLARWLALSRTTPSRDLPAAVRSSGSSSP